MDNREPHSEDRPDVVQPNGRLFFPTVDWARTAVIREVDYGLVVPRFAPSARAWLLGRDLVSESPAVAALDDCDDYDR